MAKRRKTRDLIWELYYEGCPIGVIASKLKVTERYVVKVLALSEV